MRKWPKDELNSWGPRAWAGRFCLPCGTYLFAGSHRRWRRSRNASNALDAWELQHFGSLARDGSGDFDGDGVSDLNEFFAGTDPTDPNSFLRLQIAATATPAGQFVLSWQAAPNKSYRVEYKNNLLDSAWAPLSPGATLVGEQGYAYDSGTGQRFYRVTLVP